jgi:hypothetical protein
MLNRDRCVRAIVETLVFREWGEHDLEKRVASATTFVLATRQAMPDFAGLGIRILTLGFEVSVLARQLRPFHACAPHIRARHIASWQNSRIGAFASLINFYAALTTFSVYSDIYGQNGTG